MNALTHADPFFVTAIIPVLNGEAFLRDAVRSIQQQAYRPLEIIIVDHCCPKRDRLSLVTR